MIGAGLPHNRGPCAKAMGIHEAACLIKTFEMPFEVALQEAEAAAGRGETALLIRLTNQAMPDMAGFRRIHDLGAHLLTIPFRGEGYLWADHEFRAEVETAIRCCASDSGPFPRAPVDEAAMPAPEPKPVPDLTADERREFLNAIYARHDHGSLFD